MIIDYSKPSLQIIQTDKKRPSIFKSSQEVRSFEDLCTNPLLRELSFLNSDAFDNCECQGTLKQCPKLAGIVSRKDEAGLLYQAIKDRQARGLSASQLKLTRLQEEARSSLGNPVLEPQLVSLTQLIAAEHYEAVGLILSHVKTESETFWVYSLLCSKWPSYEHFEDNLRSIAHSARLAFSLKGLSEETEGGSSKLRAAHQTKLASLFPKSYSTVLKLILEAAPESLMAERLMVCYYIEGRSRSESEVIRAATELCW